VLVSSVRPKNPDALAANVLALQRMPTAGRENMGRAARAYYELHFERGRLIGAARGGCVKRRISNGT
jgi:hypothetical protein